MRRVFALAIVMGMLTLGWTGCGSESLDQRLSDKLPQPVTNCHEVSLDANGNQTYRCDHTEVVEAPDGTAHISFATSVGSNAPSTPRGQAPSGGTQPGPSTSAAINGGEHYTLGLNLPPGEKGGKRVVGQSGCLACHKIGDSGNGSLGPNLTHIGSRASRAAILATLKAGPGIMPSFQNLGKERLYAAVNYLANLK